MTLARAIGIAAATVVVVVVAACQDAERGEPEPECPTPEEQAYFDSLDRLLRDILKEIEDPFLLADESSLGRKQASDASDQLMAAAEKMNELKELTAPESLSSFRNEVAEVADPLQKGTVLLATGFALQDPELIRDGVFVASGSLDPLSTVVAGKRDWCN